MLFDDKLNIYSRLLVVVALIEPLVNVPSKMAHIVTQVCDSYHKKTGEFRFLLQKYTIVLLGTAAILYSFQRRRQKRGFFRFDCEHPSVFILDSGTKGIIGGSDNTGGTHMTKDGS